MHVFYHDECKKKKIWETENQNEHHKLFLLLLKYIRGGFKYQNKFVHLKLGLYTQNVKLWPALD